MIWRAWYVWAELRWLTECAGYRVRPYDMIADRRRWFWQPRTPCGWFR